MITLNKTGGRTIQLFIPFEFNRQEDRGDYDRAVSLRSRAAME